MQGRGDTEDDMPGDGAVYMMGDVHGYLDKLTRLLRECGLVDEGLHWRGGVASLWFMGDFFDRGPDGTGVVDLIMRLQREAADAGGCVEALLGNHDILIMAVQQFGYVSCGTPPRTFRQTKDLDLKYVASPTSPLTEHPCRSDAISVP